MEITEQTFGQSLFKDTHGVALLELVHTKSDGSSCVKNEGEKVSESYKNSASYAGPDQLLKWWLQTLLALSLKHTYVFMVRLWPSSISLVPDSESPPTSLTCLVIQMGLVLYPLKAISPSWRNNQLIRAL